MTYPPCALSGAGCSTTYKTRWPELVGHSAGYAKSKIESENPLVTGYVIPVYTSFVPRDYCCNRVKIFLDANDKVIWVPMVG